MVTEQTPADIAPSACNFLNDSLKKAVSLVDAESGSLFLFDASTDELILDIFFNTEKNMPLRGLRQKTGTGIAGKVLGMKSPVLVTDIDRDSRFKRNGFKHYQTKSFISLPLTTPQGTVIGVINLSDKKTGEAFTQRDLDIVTALFFYATAAAVNDEKLARLTAEHEKLKEELPALKAYAMVGKLTSGILHEINNPLDGVKRYTSLLLAHIDQNSPFIPYLTDIQKGLGRIAQITKTILQFSRHRTKAVNGIHADVHTLIDEALVTLRERTPGTIRIQKRYTRISCRIMDLGLRNVFTNLIKNALDAMPDGGTLTITSRRSRAWVEIAFKDTGSGIPAELHKRVFEPFFSTKKDEEGTGLGLSISKEIIEQYNGTITIDSESGHGSTFTVVIPYNHREK